MLGTVFQKSKLPSYVLFSLTFSKNTNIISFLYKTKMISLAKVTKTRDFAFSS